LVVGASVYIIIPNPQLGWALMRINGMRVLYNSAAVALGTGVFCSLILSLAGYYLVSNSLRRDIISRTGILMAATPVTNLEFISGKFIGNVAYLASISLACMVSAMSMFFLRGEGPLEPLVFALTYAWLVFPIVVLCSAIALAFESLPVLSGRFGDFVYFLIWIAVIRFSNAAMVRTPSSGWTSFIDVTGLAMVSRILHAQFHTEEMTIGGATIDPSLPAIVFPGIKWSTSMIFERALTLFIPVLFLGLGTLWFHRFNPSRIKMSVQRGKQNIIGKMNRMLKPLTRVVWNIAPSQKQESLRNAVTADVITTFTVVPMTAIGVVGFGVACVTLELNFVQQTVLPFMFFMLTIALADIAVREISSGTMRLLFTAPRLREKYVIWKFFSILTVTLMFTLIPMVRLMTASPRASLSLLIGSCLVSSSSTSFGIMTRSPKLFVGLFLMLLYVSLNSSNAAFLDFAGFNLRATSIVQTVYAFTSIVLLLVAEMRHRESLV
jgi:ABC-type transport system involved in multi-copper enzyme maturation permease subunit